MKKRITVLFFMFIAAFAFCKTKEEIIQPRELEKIIEQHPLVEKAEIYEVYYDSLIKAVYYKSKGEEPKCTYTFDLDLTLTNGHKAKFFYVKSDLTFDKDYSAIHSIDNVVFGFYRLKQKNNIWDSYDGADFISIRDLCLIKDVDFTNLFDILNNFNIFCKVLNTLPFMKDGHLEYFYDKNHKVGIHRVSECIIEIPEE